MNIDNVTLQGSDEGHVWAIDEDCIVVVDGKAIGTPVEIAEAMEHMQESIDAMVEFFDKNPGIELAWKEFKKTIEEKTSDDPDA